MQDNQEMSKDKVAGVYGAIVILSSYKSSTLQAFKNVMSKFIVNGSMTSLEVQVISLSNFMDKLGYCPQEVNEGDDMLARGFMLKHPYIHRKCLPTFVSFNDAVILHNTELEDVNPLPFVTIKKIPRGLLEEAQTEKVVEVVGLQVVKQTIKRDSQRGSVIRTTKEFVKFV